MRKIAPAIDIFLQPGEIYFGDEQTRIRTVLGSCVAITLWHPQQKIGGMCHYMLAKRRSAQTEELDGKYADEALQLLLREIAVAGGNAREYEVKLFGGGNMFMHVPLPAKRGINVADDNVIAGRELLNRHGFAVTAEHLGGHGHRQIVFEIHTGDVWLRKHQIQKNNAVLGAEAS
ncbi:MAG: chemotaxis protein CheD [Verrucomicrobiaceae bacterium]|nr:chemotaxis protein CheD [Verrucomicrobiaceae bacterium]